MNPNLATKTYIAPIKSIFTQKLQLRILIITLHNIIMLFYPCRYDSYDEEDEEDDKPLEKETVKRRRGRQPAKESTSPSVSADEKTKSMYLLD